MFRNLPYLIIAASAHAAPLQSLWFSEPTVPARWETDSLPIGNGRLGALLFGGTSQIFVHFNDDSLWEGDENDTGSYQSFGNFTFDFAKKPGEISGYRRELDISNAVHTVSYTADSVKFHQEAFSSKPSGTIVLTCTADRPGAYSGTIRLADDHGATSKMIAPNSLLVTGKLKNGMAYASTLVVTTKGGVIETTDHSMVVTGADSISFHLAAGTNYLPDSSRAWRGEDPQQRVVETATRSAAQSTASLRSAHIADQKALFDRMNLDLGASDSSLNELDTKARLIRFAKVGEDPDFEELVFQYGRYCLIASSRPGTLPANLQGIWNRNNNPPWRSDYHSDINVDMNYWLAEPSNLGELRQPFFDYVISQIPVAERNTAAHFLKAHGKRVRGWNVQYENGIHGGGSWRWNHSGSAWFAQQFWSHYTYTLDGDFLKNKALPVFRGVAEFYEDWLIEKDGMLICPQGWSPEYGPTEDGCTYDQMFAWDAFTNYIDTCEILQVELEQVAKVKALRDRLMPLKIGSWGQLQEWMLNDRDQKVELHRHLSHLVGLHPGRQIHSGTPELLAAAKISLDARGDAGAGWSIPWKAASWARLRDGERAYKILASKLNPVLDVPGHIKEGTDGTSPNLFTIVWSVMQIDGTLGYPSAVLEMLAQSHEPETIHLLPALPGAWKDGAAKGIILRGGHQLDLAWKNSQLLTATLRQGKGERPKKILIDGQPADDRIKWQP